MIPDVPRETHDRSKLNSGEKSRKEVPSRVIRG
jgi:hypothetical protein